MASHASIAAIIDTTRQRLGFRRDKTFVPTPNVRSPQMLQEAEAFRQQLTAFEKAVKDYHRHVQGKAASSSLKVGGSYATTDLQDQLDHLQRGIDDEVLAPLRRWQEGLAVARERLTSLERMRHEVDSQRRKAEAKFRRAEARMRRAYLGAGYGSSSSSDEREDDIVPRGRLLEDYQRLALHTERQLQAIISSYQDQERLVWEQLSGLVTDAGGDMREGSIGVAVALGPSKQPLPAFREHSYATSAQQYGDVGDNMQVIQEMAPPDMTRAQVGQLESLLYVTLNDSIVGSS
eukprot:gene8052-8247_t